MALTLNNTLEVIEFMENYVERARPAEHIREKPQFCLILPSLHPSA